MLGPLPARSEMAPAFPGVAMPPALPPAADMLMGDEDALKWTKTGQSLFLERSADKTKISE